MLCRQPLRADCHFMFNIEEIMRQCFMPKRIQMLTVALIGFSLGACCFAFSEGIKVNVINEGPKPISNLKINFKGGNKALSELGAGSTHEFIVRPSGESDVGVSFIDASGIAHSHKVDVYCETNYQGKIDIRVDRFGNVTWKDDITACPN